MIEVGRYELVLVCVIWILIGAGLRVGIAGRDGRWFCEGEVVW